MKNPLSLNLGRYGHDTVVIGASMGGLAALRTLVAQFSAYFTGSLFVVQHQSARPRSGLADLLQAVTPLRVQLVDGPRPIEPGWVYVAPPDRHLVLWEDRVLVTDEPRENRTRPAINPLFRTAAATRGSRTIGVLLTGRLDDGVAGLCAIKRCGGTTIVQDPKHAEYPEMPLRALRAVEADYVLRIEEMGRVIEEHRHRPAPLAQVPDDVRVEAELSLPRASNPGRLAAIGQSTALSCPSCGGPLWRVDRDAAGVYRCSIGHALSSPALLDEQTEEIERALWVAVRSLEERGTLLDSMAREDADRGRAGDRERNAAQEAREQAGHIRRFLVQLRKTLHDNVADEESLSSEAPSLATAPPLAEKP